MKDAELLVYEDEKLRECVDAKDASDGYLLQDSMLGAAEGSGDDKGLSKKLDDMILSLPNTNAP